MATGRFAWHDLGTTDVGAAQAFYGAVFGWTFVSIPMEGFDYVMIHTPSQPIGGMNPVDAGESPHWVSYISTDDIADTIKNLTATGGVNDSGPHHIPGIGQMTYTHDPAGAKIAFFQGEGDWANVAMPLAQGPGGVPVWHELATDAVDAECAWYEELVGWGHAEWPMGETAVYHGLLYGEVPIAGAYDKTAFGNEHMPNTWMVYIEAIGTPEETVAAIVAAGGTILQEPALIEGTGTFIVAADPTGTFFGVLDSLAM